MSGRDPDAGHSKPVGSCRPRDSFSRAEVRRGESGSVHVESHQIEKGRHRPITVDAGGPVGVAKLRGSPVALRHRLSAVLL